MAMKIEAGDVKRTELFLIDPQEIVVDQSANGRWQPHAEADIAARVASFEAVGQLEPVTVRRIAGNRVQLVFGYLRHAAALEYNRRHPDATMRLKCTVAQWNDEESLVHNIRENRDRKSTSPVDDAHAQRRLREEHGYPDVKIAELYGVSGAYVSQLKKLLSLSRETQELVHRNELSVSAAMALAELPERDQKEVVAHARETAKSAPSRAEVPADASKPSRGKGRAANKVLSNSVKEQVRARNANAAEQMTKSEGTPVPGSSKKGPRNPSRTLAELRAVLDRAKLSPSDRLSKLADLILEYVAGDSTESALLGSLDSLLSE